jgi:hypothetical protein
LTASFLTGLDNSAQVEDELAKQASVELAGGVPFVSDKDLEQALEQAGVPPDRAAPIVEEYSKSRINGLRASLGILALFALVALFFGGRIPKVQPAEAQREAEEAALAGTPDAPGAAVAGVPVREG